LLHGDTPDALLVRSNCRTCTAEIPYEVDGALDLVIRSLSLRLFAIQRRDDVIAKREAVEPTLRARGIRRASASGFIVRADNRPGR
jgi:hypothetical protein